MKKTQQTETPVKTGVHPKPSSVGEVDPSLRWGFYEVVIMEVIPAMEKSQQTETPVKTGVHPKPSSVGEADPSLRWGFCGVVIMEC